MAALLNIRGWLYGAVGLVLVVSIALNVVMHRRLGDARSAAAVERSNVERLQAAITSQNEAVERLQAASESRLQAAAEAIAVAPRARPEVIDAASAPLTGSESERMKQLDDRFLGAIQ